MTIAEQKIKRYKDAFHRANGKPCEVVYVGGWFKINGDKGIGPVMLDQITAELEQRPAYGAPPMVEVSPPTPVTAVDHIANAIASIDAAMIQMTQERIHNTPLWSKLQDARSSAMSAFRKLGGE